MGFVSRVPTQLWSLIPAVQGGLDPKNGDSPGFPDPPRETIAHDLTVRRNAWLRRAR